MLKVLGDRWTTAEPCEAHEQLLQKLKDAFKGRVGLAAFKLKATGEPVLFVCSINKETGHCMPLVMMPNGDLPDFCDPIGTDEELAEIQGVSKDIKSLEE